MGQRNMICTHQMLDLEGVPGYSGLHPDHCILQGNILDHTNQNIHLTLSASGNAVELDRHQFLGHPNGGIYHGNQYSNTQNFHPVPNLDVGAVAWTNSYSPCILPSSSPVLQNTGSANHLPPFINQRTIGVSVDEDGRSNQFSYSVRGSCKRKNIDAIRGNFYHANGYANSNLSSVYLSQNSRQTHWEEPYRSGVNMLNSTTSNPSDYQVNRTLPNIEGSFRSMRNRFNSISIQPEFAFVHHFNYLLPGNYMGQSFHPATNAWVAQAGNNISNGGSSNWNYTNAASNLHGRSVSLGAVEMANMSDQGYQEIPSSLCLASLPYFQQHPQPVQNMQIQSHSHHTRIQAPHQYLLSNMHLNNPNPSSNSLLSGSGFLFFPSNAEQVYRPSRQLVQATPEVSHENVRILTSEDPGFVQLSGLFGARNIVDEHHDMRLDIDGMSYEELLALEEQIGDVNTGLTEEFILKNLKTIIHGPQMSSLPNQTHTVSPENEACIICQVEYDDEKERIGILDCGHNYHADCIKQWLLVKNLCPICKASALTTDRKARCGGLEQSD